MYGTIQKTLAVAAVTGLLAVAGCSGDKDDMAASTDAKPIRAGFVYIGPVGDHGWTYRHDAGRKELEATLGSGVQTTFVENVSEGADSARVITQLAQNNDIVFTTSFGYMNPTLEVAKNFPNVKFEHNTGYKRADNVGTYSARFYEGRYVVGHIAGRMTKTNTIGYIASFPIPEVIRGINATFLGARQVNPNIKMKIVWVNTWYDPGKESDAAKTLIDQGADIIMQHTDSAGPLQVAQERGVWAVGQASDMRAFAPKAQLTAIVNEWGPYYIRRVQAVRDGTWASDDTWDGFAGRMVSLAPYSDAIPADVIAQAETVRSGIAAGTVHPFAGPIKDQSGKVVVADGQVASDEMLLGMNFYVEGIEGSVPK